MVQLQNAYLFVVIGIHLSSTGGDRGTEHELIDARHGLVDMRSAHVHFVFEYSHGEGIAVAGISKTGFTNLLDVAECLSFEFARCDFLLC